MKRLLFVLGFLVVPVLFAGCNVQKSNDDTNGTASIVNTAELNDKIAKTEDLIHDMERDAMNDVIALFPDLTKTHTIAAEDPMNLTGLAAEDWMYSKDYDVTVIVCNGLNTPAHIFRGKTLTDAELAEAKEMMEMMMEDHEDDSMAMMSTPNYTLATASDSNALLGKEAHTVYLSAAWCSTCQSTKKKVKADLASFPAGTQILELDYDVETALIDKYGVSSQTTFLVFNKAGDVTNQLVAPSVSKLKDAITASL